MPAPATSWWPSGPCRSGSGRANLCLAAINLLPAFPLDGGRLLRGVAWAVTGDFVRGTRAASVIGRVLSWTLVGVGVVVAVGVDVLVGLWIVVIGWFLGQAAEGGYRRVAVERLVQGLKVGDVMLNDYPVVTQNLTLDTLEQQTDLAGAVFFPVVLQGSLSGAVDLAAIRRVPRGRRSTTRVSDVMKRLEALVTVHELDPLWDAVLRFDASRVEGLPVVDPADPQPPRGPRHARQRLPHPSRAAQGPGGRFRGRLMSVVADLAAPLLRLEVALERMLAGVVPLAAEEIALDEAVGRVLAAPLTARLTMPPWANSAMDGFAVRSVDVADATPEPARRADGHRRGFGRAGVAAARGGRHRGAHPDRRHAARRGGHGRAGRGHRRRVGGGRTAAAGGRAPGRRSRRARAGGRQRHHGRPAGGRGRPGHPARDARPPRLERLRDGARAPPARGSS